jgi:ER membrane protein complex subunit 1
LQSKSVLNYYQVVANLRKINTFPTYLESTSLVVASGLDIFFCKVAPSMTWDILSEEFNYFALLLTAVLLFFGIFFTRNLVKSRELARLWK